VLQLFLDIFRTVDFLEEVCFLAVLADLFYNTVYFTQFFVKFVRHVFDVVLKFYLVHFLPPLSFLGCLETVFETKFGLLQLELEGDNLTVFDAQLGLTQAECQFLLFEVCLLCQDFFDLFFFKT
jgi:hypothetical protein